MSHALLLQLGEWQRALACVQKSISLGIQKPIREAGLLFAFTKQDKLYREQMKIRFQTATNYRNMAIRLRCLSELLLADQGEESNRQLVEAAAHVIEKLPEQEAGERLDRLVPQANVYLGAAEFRTGDAAAAVTQLRKAASIVVTDFDRAIAEAYLALALRGVGQSNEAKAALQRSLAAAKAHFGSDKDFKPGANDAVNWLEFQCLRREAEESLAN